nr:uncharacterized protein LOC124808099 [Hydra vulgaris]
MNNELVKWKAQVHKYFLLYYGPFVFYKLGNAEICSLYLMLSTSIYTLSNEIVSSKDIDACQQLIYLFQKALCSYFGEGIRTFTFHALAHLSKQVKNFGPLTAMSAMLFENVNRQLKRSVTGTKGHGRQMAEKFVRFQAEDHLNIFSLNPFELGAAQNVSEKLRNMDLNDLNVDLNLYKFYNRFRVADSAYHYGKKLKSASYYAYLLIEFNVILKILFIAHNQKKILCICRLYKNVSKFHRHMDSFNIPTKIRHVLLKISPYLLLKKSGLAVFDSSKFTHYALVKKNKEIFLWCYC